MRAAIFDFTSCSATKAIDISSRPSFSQLAEAATAPISSAEPLIGTVTFSQSCVLLRPFGAAAAAAHKHLSPNDQLTSPLSSTTMSLVNLAHVCSHLQNACNVRLGLTSIPATKLHAALMLSLKQQGLISSVTLGGLRPPIPYSLKPATPPPQEPNKLDNILDKAWPPELLRAEHEKEVRTEKQLSRNPARRRLWVGLKYHDNRPVLTKLSLVSKPTRRIALPHWQLAQLIRGRDVTNADGNMVRGMTRMGECLFVSTDRGVWEVRECVEKRTGGLVVCRAW